MLTPDFAYHHEITLERFTGMDINQNTYAAPVRFRSRVNFANKRVPLNNGGAGQEIIAAGSVFLPAGTEVAPEDRITFQGKVYKVVSVQSSFWFDGRENHVEVAII